MSRIIVDAIRNSSASSDNINLDSNARVGIGTSSPACDLHVSAANPRARFTSTGNTVNYDVFMGSTNATVGTSSNHDTLFMTNDSERMRIDTSGNVGIGGTPSTKLHMHSSSDFGIRLTKTANSDAEIKNTNSLDLCCSSGGSGGQIVRILTGSAPDSLTERLKVDGSGDLRVGRVYSNTTSGGANVRVQSDGLMQRDTSSRRYKNTIADATHGLTDLNKLRPVTYKGNNDGDTVFGGLIAEEVHDAGLTEFVDYNSDNEPDALRYGNMVSLCIKAIQQLSAKIETLETKVAALEAK